MVPPGKGWTLEGGVGAKDGWVGCGVNEGGGDTAPSGPPLEEASVPAANSTMRASGRASERINRGVMSSTISVLTVLSLVEENRWPSTGSSPMPGTRTALRL